MPTPRARSFTDAGVPAASYLLYTYAAGTTTPKAAFTDSAGLVPHTNPIVLDAKGEAVIYFDGNYKLELKTPLGVTVTGYPVDNFETPVMPGTLSANAGGGLIGFLYGAVYGAGTLGRWLQDLATSAGSTFIGFLQAGVGAALMTLQTKLRQSVHVKDFGALADGTGNQLAAIQAALNASLYVDFGGVSDSYRVEGVLTLRNGHCLFGKGATITQTTINTEIFNMEGKSGVNAMGLKLVGVSTDYSDSDSSRSVGFYGGVSGSRNHIRHCHFIGLSYAAARFKAQTDCSFTYNTVEGSGSPTLTAVTSGRCYGVLFDTGSYGALVHGNDITKTAQGVILAGVRDCRITSNRLHGITGQHGIYAGAWLRNVTIAGNVIYDCDLIGIKVQAQDYTGLDNDNISITGNSVYNCRDQGILLSNAITASVYKCRNVSITGNSVKLTGGSGINVNNTIGAIVSGNTVDLAGFSGISWSESSALKIEGNLITRSGLSAMRDEVASSNISITNNKIVDCCTSPTHGGDNHGLFITAGSEYNISNNEFSDSAAKMRYGIYIISGTMSTFTVNDNLVSQSTDAGLRLGDTSAMRSYSGNCFNSTGAATFNDPVIGAAAQAGTILTIPPDQQVLFVVGTNPITYINPNGHSGRVVVLFLETGVDIRDGSNLLLNGNCLATGNWTLTIACDGTNWREVQRCTT